MQKVNDQLVKKIEWKWMDGGDCITACANGVGDNVIIEYVLVPHCNKMKH